MRPQKELTERIVLSGYPPIQIDGLEGQFCDCCGEGFWSRASERRITRLLTQHRAVEDSKRVVAADLASVREAAALLHISVQGVHKMMNDGRLPFVLAGDRKMPIRKDLTQCAREKAQTAISYPAR